MKHRADQLVWLHKPRSNWSLTGIHRSLMHTCLSTIHSFLSAKSHQPGNISISKILNRLKTWTNSAKFSEHNYTICLQSIKFRWKFVKLVLNAMVHCQHHKPMSQILSKQKIQSLWFQLTTSYFNKNNFLSFRVTGQHTVYACFLPSCLRNANDSLSDARTCH